MSPTEINVAIAELLGINQLVLMKRGLYYRPNGHGYTSCVCDAWILTEEEANKHVYPHDEPVTKHRAPIPDFYTDLNACARFEATLTLQEKEEYAYLLYNFTADSIHDHDGETHWDVICEFATMTAPQRCESFLRLKGKWAAGTTEERKDAK